MSAAAPAIELKGISKAFGPVQANKDISMSVAKGAIHGIVGENGAGKSTLMSILYGFYKADAGEIFINGKKTEIPDSQAAIRAGIGMVHQHFKLVENFTVVENVILGAEDGAMLRPSIAKARKPRSRSCRGIRPQGRSRRDHRGPRRRPPAARRDPQAALPPRRYPDPRRTHGRSDPGRGRSAFPHPRTAEGRGQDDHPDHPQAARDHGDHRHRQRDAARRDDEHGRPPTTSPAELAEMMVGRKVLLRVDKAPANPGDVVLKVEDLRVVRDGVERLKGVSLQIRAGEILGIAGVAGNGQTELLEVLGGMIPAQGGTVTLRNEEIDISGKHSNGQTRRARGFGHVPEDRQDEGLIMPFEAWENVAFGYHNDPKYNSGLLTNNAAIKADCADKMERYDVRPPEPAPARAQLLGRQPAEDRRGPRDGPRPDVLLVGQPTRGVDIGAIEFIHKQILALRDQGKAILLVSVELDEIMGFPTASR
jgi:ABC-type uncharacterized transport system ATPase subunit